MINNNFEVFERIIKEKGLTIPKVAKAAGIAPASIYAWRKGEYNIKLDKLRALAQYLECSVDTLLGVENASDNNTSKDEFEFVENSSNSLSADEGISDKCDSEYDRLSYIYNMLGEVGKSELIDFAEFLLIKKK